MDEIPPNDKLYAGIDIPAYVEENRKLGCIYSDPDSLKKEYAFCHNIADQAENLQFQYPQLRDVAFLERNRAREICEHLKKIGIWNK